MEGADMNLKTTLADAMANVAKLDACPRHLFDTHVPGIEGGVMQMFGKSMVCKKCEGKMDLLSINQYVRGYEAAGNSGNDILPGWKPSEEQRRKFFRSDD